MNQPLPGRIWVRLMKRSRVERDAVYPCEKDEVQEALREVLAKMDLSQPMWLPRHEADWEEYSLTRFRPEHFVESVDFDYMELSYIFPDDKKQARQRHILEDV
jgi:hypothetical protein